MGSHLVGVDPKRNELRDCVTPSHRRDDPNVDGVSLATVAQQPIEPVRPSESVAFLHPGHVDHEVTILFAASRLQFLLEIRNYLEVYLFGDDRYVGMCQV